MVMRCDVAEFADMERTLDEIAANSHLVFIQKPPVLNSGDQCTVDVFGGYWRKPGSFEPLSIREPRNEHARRRRFESALRGHFAGNPNFTFLETEGEFVGPDGRIRWWDGKSKLHYIDDNHLSEAGVALFADRLDRALRSLLEPASR